MSNSSDSEILLGVSGSIACYKSCEITSSLVQDGIGVNVVLTETAAAMVSSDTFSTLSQRDVYLNLFDEPEDSWPVHIDLANRVDLALIAPATANIIGKIANGIADDLLSSLVMSINLRVPVIISPAMNSKMYENPLFQNNLETLRDMGYQFVKPGEGYMACGDRGKGRLAGVEKILTAVREEL